MIKKDRLISISYYNWVLFSSKKLVSDGRQVVIFRIVINYCALDISRNFFSVLCFGSMFLLIVNDICMSLLFLLLYFSDLIFLTV